MKVGEALLGRRSEPKVAALTSELNTALEQGDRVLVVLAIPGELAKPVQRSVDAWTIAELLAERLVCQSALGVGSRFSFRLRRVGGDGNRVPASAAAGVIAATTVRFAGPGGRRTTGLGSTAVVDVSEAEAMAPGTGPSIGRDPGPRRDGGPFRTAGRGRGPGGA
jgi:hypothetical protein